MSFVNGLICRECGHEYPKQAIHVCEFCFGPLEVDYDYEKIAKNISRAKIQKRDYSIWRYKELLPIDDSPTVGTSVGYTPLIKADNLAAVLGVGELYIKNDAVCYPTLSFKDRVVSVALSKAKEFGFETVSCASTGNLANSVSALSASAGLQSYIFIPNDLEQSKIVGTTIYKTNLIEVNGHYDDVNRLCSEIAGSFGWGFVNINLRPYYAEGSKSFAYEFIEQMGWKVPQNVVIPMASGSLLTKIWKAINEFHKIGLIDSFATKVFGAQAKGCSPISTAVKNKWKIEQATDLQDGTDITSDYTGEVWEFTKDGDYLKNSTLKGTYTFSDDKLTLIILGIDGGSDSYKILKMKKRKCGWKYWVRRNYTGLRIKIIFEQCLSVSSHHSHDFDGLYKL